MSIRRLIYSCVVGASVLFAGCMIRSFDGTIVYDGRQKQPKENAGGKQSMRKPKVSINQPANGGVQLYAGLRRSNYGLAKKNNADDWWAIRARDFATTLNSSIEGVGYVQPVIIEIVSGFNEDGTTNIFFEKPPSYTGSTRNIAFHAQGEINHERALSVYDELGVKAIIQFEPGNSDMLSNIELAHQAFGHHKCIIGYGLDAEWYFTRESSDSTGKVIEDGDAQKWMEKVLSLDSTYTLFIKHWIPSHMPRTYRHPKLWFLSDSQIFPDLDSLMDDFKFWAGSHEGQTVGFQFGYPSDRKWWKELNKPPIEITQRILTQIASCKYVFWVDFTADEVDFY